MKPDINDSDWRSFQEWGTPDGSPPNFFSFRAKRRFDPRAVKGGATAVFVKGLLTVDLGEFDVPGWEGDIFANLRVVYQGADGRWRSPAVWPMKRGVNDFGITDLQLVIDIPDGAWVGVLLQNPKGVRTDVAVIRYEAGSPPPPPPPNEEEEENMSVPVNALKQKVIVLEGDASENLTDAVKLSDSPTTITMAEVRVIREEADERVQIVLRAAAVEIAEFWTEPGRDFYAVPIYPGVEIDGGELVRALARFPGPVNVRVKFRGYLSG